MGCRDRGEDVEKHCVSRAQCRIVALQHATHENNNKLTCEETLCEQSTV
jgi:hypothetical protein